MFQEIYQSFHFSHTLQQCVWLREWPAFGIIWSSVTWLPIGLDDSLLMSRAPLLLHFLYVFNSACLQRRYTRGGVFRWVLKEWVHDDLFVSVEGMGWWRTYLFYASNQTLVLGPDIGSGGFMWFASAKQTRCKRQNSCIRKRVKQIVKNSHIVIKNGRPYECLIHF